jgi:hypothetical protein
MKRCDTCKEEFDEKKAKEALEKLRVTTQISCQDNNRRDSGAYQERQG